MNDDPMYDRDRDLDSGYDPDYDPDQDPGVRRAGSQGRGAMDKGSSKPEEGWGNQPDEDDVMEGQSNRGQGGIDQDFDHDLDDTYDQ